MPCMFKLTESRISRSVLLYTLPTRPNPGLHVQTESRGRKLPTSSASAKIQTPELASLAIEVQIRRAPNLLATTPADGIISANTKSNEKAPCTPGNYSRATFSLDRIQTVGRPRPDRMKERQNGQEPLATLPINSRPPEALGSWLPYIESAARLPT